MHYTKEDIQVQNEFLKLVHPFLADNEYHKECVQILPLIRNNKGEGKSDRLFNIWRLDDKGKEYYNKFIDGLNKKPYVTCTYYSGFAKMEKNNITNSNTVFTQILPMDFDHQSYNEVMEQLSIFKKLGIDYNIVFTGGGYQVIILLDKPCYDKNIYNKFTTLLKSLGLKVDNAIKDSARVLRLPNTYNSKYKTPVKTKLMKFTYERYSTQYIFDKISEYLAQITSFDSEDNLTPTSTPKNSKKGQKNASKHNDLEFGDNSFKPYINFNRLPEPIKEMLLHTPEHYRNKTLYFLVPFIRHSLGMSKKFTVEIMKLWGKNCSPSLEPDFVESEVDRLWYANYNAPYTKELATRFGYIKLVEFKQGDNEIIIDNTLFKKYNKVHEAAVKIYMVMKIEEHLNKITEWTSDLICEKVSISKRSFERYIKDLLDSKLLYKVKASDYIAHKYNCKYVYIINNKKRGYGFTKIDVNRIENVYFNERYKVNNTNAKMFFYIVYMLHNNSNSQCWASQETLGEEIGKGRTAANKILNGLCNNRWLNKIKYIDKNTNIEHCKYELIR
jgi:predicted transcriptional regulator